MKKFLTLLGVGLFIALPSHAVPFLTSGLGGQTVSGSLASPLYHYTIVNSSPTAVVQDGNEFSASFQDVFGQIWYATADFQDNFQIDFHFSSPNPGANIGAGEIILWHFTGFNFKVAGLQELNTPPIQDRSLPSFDQDNIWVGFDGLTAYSPWNLYTYQIQTTALTVPNDVPEVTSTLPLLLVSLSAILLLARLSRRTSTLAGLN